MSICRFLSTADFSPHQKEKCFMDSSPRSIKNHRKKKKNRKKRSDHWVLVVKKQSQVDEVINICCPLRERYHNASAGFKRCLKLSITDGVQRVFGMEYRPIRDLDVVGPAGLKEMSEQMDISYVDFGDS